MRGQSHAGQKVSDSQRTGPEHSSAGGHGAGAGTHTGRIGADERDFSGGGEETFYETSDGSERGGAGAGADGAATDDPKPRPAGGLGTSGARAEADAYTV